MIILAHDLALATQTDLLMMLEWVRSLPCYSSIEEIDRTTLLKRFAVFNLVLENGYYTAAANVNDVWLISNGTCMPRNVEVLPEESKHLLPNCCDNPD
uniref:NR LBD domain-containing protein n=1 Tax=Heterorhabditis bacteriophora TaxID=37862 RepID=A0A1I7XV45_HETBA